MILLRFSIIALFLTFISSSCGSDLPNNEKALKEPSTIEELGELLFHDSILSRGN